MSRDFYLLPANDASQPLWTARGGVVAGVCMLFFDTPYPGSARELRATHFGDGVSPFASCVQKRGWKSHTEHDMTRP